MAISLAVCTGREDGESALSTRLSCFGLMVSAVLFEPLWASLSCDWLLWVLLACLELLSGESAGPIYECGRVAHREFSRFSRWPLRACIRRFYPKRHTVHSDYTCFISTCVPWESNPQPFTLLTQCSITEPQEQCNVYFECNVSCFG